MDANIDEAQLNYCRSK